VSDNSPASGEVLVRLRGLVKQYGRRGVGRRGGATRALDGVDLDIARGETLGVVGESGCGKSTLARAIVRLIPLDAGSIELDGQDVTHLSRRVLRPLRRRMQLVFQDSFASLNPRHTVGSSIGEALRVHHLASRAERPEHVDRLMALVGLSPELHGRFPRELSGGQRQRVSVARALAVRPELLVCDEPVSALDVSIQAQIVNLLLDLRDELGLTYVFISHDLAVVHQLADRVAVMYLGRVVELRDAEDLFDAPMHPYTAALLSAAPVPDPSRRSRRTVLQGDPPRQAGPVRGCSFQPRCPRAEARCLEERPALTDHARQGLVACHFPLLGGVRLEESSPAPHELATPFGP
jgi:oligopeptide/dipeptide ABC transporter ATP-binding protein